MRGHGADTAVSDLAFFGGEMLPAGFVVIARASG
jgi:hypothetical protein